MVSSVPGPLLKVADHSTVLAPNDALQRLLGSLEKHHLIRIVLFWIKEAQHAPSPNLLPPQLSRRSSRKQQHRFNIDDELSQPDSRASTSSFLDLHEERRARSYKELTTLWAESMSDVKVPRSKAMDRILNVDWPTGLTYGMVATLSFESVRASPTKRPWQTIRLDYGEEEETRQVQDKGEAATLSRTILQRLTPGQLRERFSSELRHYCSHALFLDAAVQSSGDDDILDPLPDNWCRFFTHLRVVTITSPIDVCLPGLHVLHIPHSSWCLISGNLGRSGERVREMALTALAHSLGARRAKVSWVKGSDREEEVADLGKMAELNGKDPLGLRDILLSAGLLGEVVDDDEQDLTGKGVGGGKGRSMRRGEAEDGPLVRAEKRMRQEGSGLYAEWNKGQEKWQEDDFDEHDLRHPALQQQARREKRRKEHRRTREVADLLGKYEDLPRLERLRLQLNLPFPTLDRRGATSQESVQDEPVVMRLQGTHVLAGLQRFVETGLDCASEGGSEESAGLPTWLTEIRSTRVSVGLDPLP